MFDNVIIKLLMLLFKRGRTSIFGDERQVTQFKLRHLN